MPWPHSPVPQVTSQHGLDSREGGLTPTVPQRSGQAARVAAPSSTAGQTDTLSPGAGRAGERQEPTAKGNLIGFTAETKTRQRDATGLLWALLGSGKLQTGFSP